LERKIQLKSVLKGVVFFIYRLQVFKIKKKLRIVLERKVQPKNVLKEVVFFIYSIDIYSINYKNIVK